MTEPNNGLTADAAAIEAAFGRRWGVWLSDTGWWWAARVHHLSSERLSAGCVPFLHADNPGELAELIRQQERLCPPPAADEVDPRPRQADPGPGPGPAEEETP